jgi:hypothetical protein
MHIFLLFLGALAAAAFAATVLQNFTSYPSNGTNSWTFGNQSLWGTATYGGVLPQEFASMTEVWYSNSPSAGVAGVGLSTGSSGGSSYLYTLPDLPPRTDLPLPVYAIYLLGSYKADCSN